MTSDSKHLDLRSEADRLIAAGSPELASLRLAELWRAESSAGAAAFLVSRYEQLRGKLPLVPYRIAILRSFTVEPAIPLLRAEAFVHGIDLYCSTRRLQRLRAGNPRPREFSLPIFPGRCDSCRDGRRISRPDLWQEYPDLAPEAPQRSHTARLQQPSASGCERFRERSRPRLIVHSLELPARPGIGTS